MTWGVLGSDMGVLGSYRGVLGGNMGSTQGDMGVLGGVFGLFLGYFWGIFGAMSNGVIYSLFKVSIYIYSGSALQQQLVNSVGISCNHP